MKHLISLLREEARVICDRRRLIITEEQISERVVKPGTPEPVYRNGDGRNPRVRRVKHSDPGFRIQSLGTTGRPGGPLLQPSRHRPKESYQSNFDKLLFFARAARIPGDVDRQLGLILGWAIRYV